MNKRRMDEATAQRKRAAARGVGMIEIIIVMAVIAIISAVAVLGITKARNTISLQNSARTFAGYAEKARIDAIRRHDWTNIDITGPNTYTIRMDFDGAGTVTDRTFRLEKGISFTDSTNTAYTVDGSGNVSSSNGDEVSTADFNFRGRTARCSMFFRMKNSNNERSAVQVAGSGDVTIDSGVSTPAAVTSTNVNTNADVVASTVVNGTFTPYELVPCSTSGGAPPVIVPPVATCVGGSIGADIGSVSVRKNGGSTATVRITVTGPGTIVAVPNSNLQVTPTTQSVTSSTGGTFSFTISSITRTKASNPPFTVAFNNPCSSVTIYVTVTN